MRCFVYSCRVLLAIALGLLVSSSATYGATPANPLGAPSRNGVVAALQAAYSVLSRADHDYHGHRVNAMHEIQAACKLLGADPTGDATGNEPQGTSDAQLRTAGQILLNVRAVAASGNQIQVVQHIDNAINQIKIALSIK